MLQKAKDLIAKLRTRAITQTTNATSATRVSRSDFAPVAIGNLRIRTQACDNTGTPTESWKTVVDDSNLVVENAQSLMAAMAAGATDAPLNYIELGDPSPATPPTLSDTSLEQTTGTRKAATVTTSGNTVNATVTFLTTEGNGFTFTEAGLFTGPFAAGGMFARKVFADVTKTSSFQLELSWTITFLVQTGGTDCTGVGFVGPGSVAAFTYYTAAGGENSIAATFDFSVSANRIMVYLNGQRLIPNVHYSESGPTLNAPIGGPALNKGINLISFSAALNDKFFLFYLATA